MNNTLWNLFEIIVNIFEEFVILHFICKFLRHDFNSIKGKVTYILGAIFGAVVVTIIDYLTDYAGFLGIIYVSYWLFFSIFFINGKNIHKLFAVLLANIVVICSSSLVTISISSIFKSHTDEIYSQHGLTRFLAIALVQVMLIYVYSIILKIADKTLLLMSKKDWVLVIGIFLISFLAIVVIHSMFYLLNPDSISLDIILTSEIGIVLLNLFCFYLLIALNKSNRAAEELKLKEQQYEYSVRYAENIRNQYEEIRNIRHDIKQHFAVICRLQQEGNLQGAVDYTSECLDRINQLDMFMDIGNDFVNAIINSKFSVAKSKDIEVLCSSNGLISGINEYDLCNLLGNMLDNAIEGTERVIGCRFVEVDITSNNYMVNICVSNTITNSVLSSNNKLKTNKTDTLAHGFGLKTISLIADKYHGNTFFYEEDLVFFCRVILYKDETK